MPKKANVAHRPKPLLYGVSRNALVNALCDIRVCLCEKTHHHTRKMAAPFSRPAAGTRDYFAQFLAITPIKCDVVDTLMHFDTLN